jgi:hypothetical protein
MSTDRDVYRTIERAKKIGAFALLFVGLALLFQHQILYFAEREFLAPDEDTAKVLYVHQRHFLGPDTVFPIEARHVDWRSDLDWCVKGKDGLWYSYFRWDDGL